MTTTKSRGRAFQTMDATAGVTALDDLIDTIRIEYRLAKSAEQARIRIDQGLYAFARVFLTGWHPQADERARKQAAERARKAVDGIRKGKEPSEHDAPLHMALLGLVTASQASWDAFDDARKQHRRAAERAVVQLPAWQRLQHIRRGFSTWGLAVIIGEAGDIGGYSGCRKLFKRLGLAPDECYPKGEKHTGRMIPRNSRGRIMGVIADPLLRAQWRGERYPDGTKITKKEDKGKPGNIPARPIGPYGQVYASAKARYLASGKADGHAEKAARRAMVKALLHDVHAAWHGRELDYAKTE